MKHFFGVTLQPALHWLQQFISYMNYGCCFFKLFTVVPQIIKQLL